MADENESVTVEIAIPSPQKGKKPKRLAINFGSVTVQALSPNPVEVDRNIKAGQLALARARDELVKPGVRIGFAKGVPLFHADPKRPGKVVRELNGKRESGEFVGDEFIVCQ